MFDGMSLTTDGVPAGIVLDSPTSYGASAGSEVHGTFGGVLSSFNLFESGEFSFSFEALFSPSAFLGESSLVISSCVLFLESESPDG